MITKQQIKNLLQKENPTILEIGAHYGEDSIEFLKTFQNITLHCFEPDPRNITIIKKYHPQLHLHQTAISNQNANNIDFHMSYQEPTDYTKALNKYNFITKKDYIQHKLHSSGASSLKTGHQLLQNAQTTKITTTTLDTWCKQNNITNIDLIWIDVQGAEKQVIQGAQNTLQNTNYIYIEYGETTYQDGMNRQQTIELITKQNYQIINKHSDTNKKGNLLLKRKQNT